MTIEDLRYGGPIIFFFIGITLAVWSVRGSLSYQADILEMDNKKESKSIASSIHGTTNWLKGWFWFLVACTLYLVASPFL